VQSSIISGRVTGAFLAVLVILVLAFVASVRSASRLPDLDVAVTHAHELLDEIAVTRTTLHEVESARRSYFLTRQKPVLEAYLAATKDAVAHLDRLTDLTSGDPLQRRRVDAVGPLIAEQVTLLTNAIAAQPQAGEPQATAPDDGSTISEQIRGFMLELEDDARAKLRDDEIEASSRRAKVIRSFGAIALISLLLLGGAYYVLDRDAAVHAVVLEELHAYRRPADPPSTATTSSSEVG